MNQHIDREHLNNPVTRDAINSFSNATDPRLAEVMGLLVKHLHAFVDERVARFRQDEG